MKKAIITGVRQAELVDVPDPQPKADWVVVKNHVAPMCTEYKAYAAGGRHEQLGHEAAGEVVAVAQPGRVQVGDRVVVMPLTACGRCALCLAGDYIHCQDPIDFAAFHGTSDGSATMAQYVLKPDWLLVPIPDGISYAHASMACCGLGPTFGALERIRAGALDTLLIAGLGPVGLGGVINAVGRGAHVIGVEGNAYRARLALELGAAAVIDPTDEDAQAQILALTRDGRGVEHAIDCTGVPAAHRLCIEATRRLGTVTFVGESGSQETTLRVSPDLIRKGLAFYGSWHYPLPGTPKLLRVIAEQGAKLDKLISHTFPLKAVGEAWELQMSGRCAKVLLTPWEGGR